MPPVPLDHRARSLRWRQAGPRDEERHFPRLVHAARRKISQFAEFAIGRKAKFEAGTCQPEPEKRPVIDEHSRSAERRGKRLGVQHGEAGHGAGERDVEPLQAACLGGRDPGRLDYYDMIEL